MKKDPESRDVRILLKDNTIVINGNIPKEANTDQILKFLIKGLRETDPSRKIKIYFKADEANEIPNMPFLILLYLAKVSSETKAEFEIYHNSNKFQESIQDLNYFISELKKEEINLSDQEEIQYLEILTSDRFTWIYIKKENG